EDVIVSGSNLEKFMIMEKLNSPPSKVSRNAPSEVSSLNDIERDDKFLDIHGLIPEVIENIHALQSGVEDKIGKMNSIDLCPVTNCTKYSPITTITNNNTTSYKYNTRNMQKLIP
ncbi:hypothetical protein CEXT_745811, partial [Caerostris extrusa]